VSFDQQVARLGADQATEPPDTQLAVGPNEVLELVNSSFSVWTKTGTLISMSDLNLFFRIPAGSYFADPRALFDGMSARWFLAGFSLNRTGTQSQAYLAVSQSADPRGTWWVYTSQIFNLISDQPKMAATGDKIILSWNDYGCTTCPFAGEETWVIQKSDVIAGASASYSYFGPDTMRSSLAAAVELTASDPAYLVYDNNTVPSYIGVVTITGTPRSGNVQWTEVDSSIQPTVVPPPARQPGTAAPLSPKPDNRLVSAAWAGGVLWTAANDSCLPVGDTTARSCLRLIEVSTAGSASVALDRDFAVSGDDLSYPAVMNDLSGNLFVTYTESSPSLYASAVAFGWPLGTPGPAPPALLGAGAGAYDFGPCSNPNRWGDYSGAAQDPANPTDVWLAAEDVGSATNSCGWGTAIGRLTLSAPSVVSLTPTSGPAGGGTTITITGSDFVGGRTSVTFGTVASTSVAVQSPNQLQAIAPAQAPGPVSVTVATMDGSSAASAASQFTYSGVSQYRFAPSPIAPIGTLSPGQTVAVALTALDSTGSPVSGATVYMAFAAAAGGGSAAINGTPLTTTPAAMVASAAGQLNVTYNGPPAGPSNGGTDVLSAQNTSIGPGVIAQVAYSFSPARLPTSPTNVVALGGEASASVYWSAPASTGTSPITGYTVTASPGSLTSSVGSSVSSAVVSGLADANSYTFTVTATNAVGTSPPSLASNAVVAGRGAYQSLPPTRILDTRNGTGAPKQPVGSNSSVDVKVTGTGSVPVNGVAAVVLNVTVTNTTASSYLTLWPTGFPRPLASNLNWAADNTVPNLVEVAVGINGSVSIYNAYGSVDVIFDVAGYVLAPTASPGPDGRFNAVVPVRVLDTRTGTGAVKAPVGAGKTITVQIGGMPGSNVPSSGVAAVVLNVTVTNATGTSYLTVWPAGGVLPLASNLNFAVGQTVPNRVVVQVGTGANAGKVSFYNASGNVDVIADVGGWFTDTTSTAAGSLFVGVTPVRILDTRDGTGGVSTPLGPGATIAMQVAGQGGVPPMTAATPPTAVVLNITVTGPSAPSYLAAWPDGTQQPLASDLNYVAGQTVPNLVVVKVAADGKVDLFNAFGSTQVVVDVVGWYG
jgi:hypothetical protein